MEHITEVLSNLEFSEERFPVPHTFISRLKEYFPDIATEPRFKVILHRVLWDDQWWQYTCEDYETWDDFECAFINYYWSETIQEKWEDIINNGLYSSNHGDKRNYAMRLFRIGRQLGLRETKLINKLTRHFDINVQSFLTVGPVNSITSLVKLIEASDNFQRNAGQRRHHQGTPLQYQEQLYQAYNSVKQDNGTDQWGNCHERGENEQLNEAEQHRSSAEFCESAHHNSQTDEIIESGSEEIDEDDQLEVPEDSGAAGPYISQADQGSESDSQEINESVVSVEEIPSVNCISELPNSTIPPGQLGTNGSTGAPPKVKLRSFTEWTNQSSTAAYQLHFQVAHVRILSAPITKFKPVASTIILSTIVSIPASNLQGTPHTTTDEINPKECWVWDPGGRCSGFSLHLCTVALRQHCAVMEQRGKQIYFLDQSHIGPD
uniref:Activity-regulated cytoskeleton-associated protein n=1 Tax=Lygus hesperus TaxID=30085 RepID=A0A0A9ZGF4_LYGHE